MTSKQTIDNQVSGFRFQVSRLASYLSPIIHHPSPISRLPILLVLLLHFALALAYAGHVPLGEAPDEPAHLRYARFIAEHGRLPATLAERQEAGYRSAWPPLYHFLVAGPLALNGDTPPTRLKAVGDSPRRLIPTNGQTIAAFIHTADETPPWRGLPLAWHLSRLISVALTTLAVTLTYAIAWRLTRQRLLAATAAALHAFIPQVLFIGSALNDDNLLICLSGFVFLILINYAKRPTRPQAFLLGALLGLATVAKYNALPLWAFTITWLIWFQITTLSTQQAKSHYRPFTIYNSQFTIHYLLLFTGAFITTGWWFSFTWLNFNQVERLGWLPGSLAALSAGASDASLRHIAAGGFPAFPPASAWLEWFITLFETFWGNFGGGSAIDLPAWVYGLLAMICLLAIIPYGIRAKPPFLHVSPLTLFLLSPLFFLPLPMIRFALTGSLVETAQGRHLFPALPAITLGLVWGLSRFTIYDLRLTICDLRFTIYSSRFTLRHSLWSQGRLVHALRFTLYALRFTLPLFLFLLSLYSLNLIQAGYPPPIPLRTTADAATAEHVLRVKVAESITLVGYEVGEAGGGVLPVTLVWQANSSPPEDYLIELTLNDEAGQSIGAWLGHPLGGRYPTRAWDKGDVLRHTIPIPILPNQTASSAALTLRLLNSFNQPIRDSLTVIANLPLSSPPLPCSPAPLLPCPPAPLLPTQLRADELPPASPFTYRSTLSFVLAAAQPPELIAPNGQTISPTYFLPGPQGSIAHFIVAADWPSGAYSASYPGGDSASYPGGDSASHPVGDQLPLVNGQWSITNRLRQFEPPPIQYPVKANFADTLTLLGYDLPQRRVQPGSSFPITLHWRAERTIGLHLVVFNHLLNEENIQYGGADRVPQLYYTTWLWVPNEIVSDAYEVPVAAGAPPGVYWLDAGLYPSEQPTFSLPLVVDGQPLDRNSVRLGPLKVGGPPPGVTVPAVQPQNPLNLTFGDQITLLGFNLNVERSTLNVQRLTLFWRTETLPSADYTVFIHLLDPAGNLAAQFDSPPAGGVYPSSLWEPGEIVVDEHRLGELPPGRYTVQIGLYRPDTGERLFVAGSPDGAVRLVEIEGGE